MLCVLDMKARKQVRLGENTSKGGKRKTLNTGREERQIIEEKEKDKKNKENTLGENQRK